LEEVRRKWRRKKAQARVAESAPGWRRPLEHSYEKARADVQQDTPMVFSEVDADTVAAVVGDWNRNPDRPNVKTRSPRFCPLPTAQEAGVGQDHAMDAIAKRIRRAAPNWTIPTSRWAFSCLRALRRGQDETAHALSELLYSGDESLIVINMSEFQEAHTVSTLKGAPAGYVGYGQGAVDRGGAAPAYSVVLLDEWKRPTQTCTRCSSRCLTRVIWMMPKAAISTSRTR